MMLEACQEVISIKAIRYILESTFYPIDLYCDNKTANDYTEKESSHKFVKEFARLQRIKVRWISGKKNMPDNMTKPLLHQIKMSHF